MHRHNYVRGIANLKFLFTLKLITPYLHLYFFLRKKDSLYIGCVFTPGKHLFSNHVTE